MSNILLGKKIGMTQIYDDYNNLSPVTLIQAGPCPITQVKTKKFHGYSAIQVGYGVQKKSRISKCRLGELVKANLPLCTYLKEFRISEITNRKVGDILTVSQFKAGDTIDVTSKTKGKGFQGVVKRWGFSGGPSSHGSMFHRRGGSYGMCQWPGKVYKGRKMPGHMGNKQRTVQNLTIMRIVEDKNIIIVKGSFPGYNNCIILIRTAKKTIQKMV